MPKKKKTSVPQNRKEEEARRYNIYKKRVFALLREMGCGDAVQYVDRNMLRVLYAARPTLIRKIENAYTQMTAGTMTQSLQFSADYAFSRAVTLRAYYDLQINTPLVSSTSYPTSNSDYGISIRLSLTQ